MDDLPIPLSDLLIGSYVFFLFYITYYYIYGTWTFWGWWLTFMIVTEAMLIAYWRGQKMASENTWDQIDV